MLVDVGLHSADVSRVKQLMALKDKYAHFHVLLFLYRNDG